ncbi:MAG: high-potential iron-sulfur protein [Gammaproteobacteria bacterium]|nr:high-potential iron-sulfur protein [Gammaproteobacteria bacterium]MBU1480071.1 high-potential iron-sulfur protein [Gammaproteobacteria bacterium]
MGETFKNTISPTAGTGQKQLLSRRAVLRSVLIAGCSLIVPITLLNACSNNTESSAPTLPEKLPKTDVKYQPGPKGTQKCSNCMNFISASSTCQRVEGLVSPDGWCSLWARNA